MTQDAPASLRKGKAQRGGDSFHPGPVSPPGAGPGWTAGDGPNDVVTGPLSALRAVAGRFGSGLEPGERIAFLRATVTRGQQLDPDDLSWLLDYAEGRAARDRVILAALESFCDGLVGAVSGNGRTETD